MKGHSVQKSGNKWMDRQMDRVDCVTCFADAVGNKSEVQEICDVTLVSIYEAVYYSERKLFVSC